MEKAKALAQQQQQQILLQQQHQHQQQQSLLLRQIQQQAISRFPSNIDAYLRPQFRPIKNQQQQQQSPIPNPNHPQNPTSAILQPNRPQGHPHISPENQVELKIAYQDAWRVCHPDFKHPFSSLEDACERLLPYHVVADYEAEEDDRILYSDTTGQALSRSQQWDHNITNKIAEFTETFEKQVHAFNVLNRKRANGEYRTEERLMVEQLLLQDERRALFESRAELEARQKAGREAQAASFHMAAMAQAEQARAEMRAWAPIRASTLGRNEVVDQDQEVNPDELMNGWARDEKEPCEDFLNDEERENGDWREGGEFDLNTR